ncbi:hypothetical protein Q5P01_004562 [Channa striata]|uniref:Interferon-induced protein 44-like n=1 Tax=Channa striata TaxID=64152 RepID=A0AA88NBZ9_CHASR|nr:hypothetical protein Q5P01_004562 [Channa striata]
MPLFKRIFHPPPPPPSPFLDEPWRQINWGDKQGALQHVNIYKPFIEGAQLRILVHGAVGAGKSSFVNTVQSVLRGRMAIEALADNTSHGCFTKKFKTYKIEKGSPDTFYPFVFNDIMGLSAENGVPVGDVELALAGHMKDGYNLNPESRLSIDGQFYNRDPTANDKVHVLVCVVAADTLPSMSKAIVEKIQSIREEASRLGIPQVALLTKVDLACPEINTDLKNVYRSKCLKQKMEQFSANVGIPMNCIFL